MAGSVERLSWDQAEWMACYATGRDLWKQTDYKPADVDTAQLYDGFSFQALAWIESLGFCEIGDGGKYIEGDRKSVVEGKSVSVRVDPGGRRIIKKKTKKQPKSKTTTNTK